MRRSLLAVLAPLLWVSPASAALTGPPCPKATGLECPALSVPIDRTGAIGGTIALNVRRAPATSGAPATTALVPLAGGPGQAAVPLTKEFARSLAAGLVTRDLVVFDQRGTGGSSPLRCSALGSSSTSRTTAARRCAAHLGPARGKFTTLDSVADLEALRVAGGYEKLALYGVSYGTKVALEYAAVHPDRVESLLLDSVVAPEGPDPLQLSTFARVGPALAALCAGRCSGITTSPRRDLASLVSRLRRRTLDGRVFDSRGRARGVSVSRGALLTTLIAGDLNPALRAQTPAAVHAALRGDGAPIARLRARAAGLVARQADDENVDEALFTATVCEELPFPWDRNAGPDTRARQAVARVNALRPSQVAPFDRGTALSGGLLPLCLAWPTASPPPPSSFSLPQVPALILEGQQDLRTPVEDAAAVAQRLGPATQTVVVGDVGHSVLGSDPTKCAQSAVVAFYGGVGAQPCTPSDPIVAPTRVPPRSLGSLPRAARLRGRAGQTLTAVSRTLGDVRASVLTKLFGGSAAPRVGGLRGGSLRVSGSTIRLSRYAFVPGVAVSGTVPTRGAIRLTVSGSAAGRGSVVITSSRVSGRLAGRRFSVALARSASLRPPAGLRGPRYPRLARVR